VYATCINMLDALRGFSSSWHEYVGMRHIHKRETLLVCTKRETMLDFRHENGAPLLLYSHSKSLVRIVFCVL